MAPSGIKRKPKTARNRSPAPKKGKSKAPQKPSAKKTPAKKTVAAAADDDDEDAEDTDDVSTQKDGESDGDQEGESDGDQEGDAQGDQEEGVGGTWCTTKLPLGTDLVEYADTEGKKKRKKSFNAPCIKIATVEVLKRKSEALWKFVDGPRPRIPWLPIEDYLISVMLLKKKVYHNGAFYVCTRYTPGKFVQVKEFFTDFEPVWMRNNRDMSHVNDRLSVLRSGGGATTMSGVIAKRFMAEAARDFKVDLVRKIMGRIMALDMNEDVDPIRKKFTDLVKDYTELVKSFYQFCKQQGVKRKVSGESAHFVLDKVAPPRAKQPATAQRDTEEAEAIEREIAEREIADSFMFLEDKEAYDRAEIENTEGLRKKYGLPPSAALRAVTMQRGASEAAAPVSGNVGGGHSSDLYTVYIAERGPDGNIVGSFAMNPVAASALAWKRLKELHLVIWPKVRVTDPSYRKVADVLVRFDPSPSMQGGIRMPYQADSTWTAYAPSTFAPPLEGEDGLETIFSVDALCENEGTMTFGDLGFPNPVCLTFERIFEDEKDYETRVQKYRHCRYPVKWVGGGQEDPL